MRAKTHFNGAELVTELFHRLAASVAQNHDHVLLSITGD